MPLYSWFMAPQSCHWLQRDREYINCMTALNTDDKAKPQSTDSHGSIYTTANCRMLLVDLDGTQHNNAGGSAEILDIILARLDPEGKVSWVAN